MNRKKNRKLFILFFVTFLLTSVFCNGQYGQLRRASIDFGRFFQETHQLQKMPNWCWVACVSMIFNYYGHPISQERLVTEIYGAPFNLPSGNGLNISILLNRDWVDDRGRAFKARITGIYDFMANTLAITNIQIINELLSGHPIVIGVGTHAVVLIGVSYYLDPWGNPIVTVATVADPWPGRGIYDIFGPSIVPVHLGGNLIYICIAGIE
jgi:hypothetical protein